MFLIKSIEELVKENVLQVVYQAADLLYDQWPHQSKESRIQSMLGTTQSDYLLPRTFLLLDAQESNIKCIGHARVAPASDQMEGKAAILYSLLISPQHRRKGLGKMMMKKVEDYAVESGFFILYLFTDDQECFYSHCGYLRSPKTSTLGNLSSKISPSQLKGLENLFAKRGKDKTSDEAVAREGTVWMRKIIRESDSTCYNILSPEGLGRLGVLKGTYINIQWQHQVGPSCGLVLLRMIHHFLSEHSGEPCRLYQFSHEKTLFPLADSLKVWVPSVPVSDSLLQFARDLGYSKEGEILSCDRLASLAHSFYSIKAETMLFPSFHVLKDIIDSYKVILLAYDREPGNHPRIPPSPNYQRPHWILIVGYAVHTENIIGLHGMSREPLICKWSDLKASNASLNATGVRQSYKGRDLAFADDTIHLSAQVVVVRLSNP